MCRWLGVAEVARGHQHHDTLSLMASIAHVVVGVAGARALGRSRWLSWRVALTLGALSMLADVDVLTFRLGIPYSAPFGHRGVTHSLLFAMLAGTAAGLWLAQGGRWPFWPATVVACLVAASHPVLDAMTDGGLGVALLWPFSNARFFAPWRPIPVAPIGARMLSSRGFHVLAVEAIWSVPLLIWAAWPRGVAPGRPRQESEG
jgi:inner membrane protein